ncbi:hypothetical protein BLD44_013365 [Mastigocladus laminosus UU774]|nr:hypothetical protein BLD44_013365 [Mastigocladus laminosus UU774]
MKIGIGDWGLGIGDQGSGIINSFTRKYSFQQEFDRFSYIWLRYKHSRNEFVLQKIYSSSKFS